MSDQKMRVVLFEDDGLFVAQGLEYDICTQAETLSELITRFEMTLDAEAKEPGGLERLEPAPATFFRKWEQAAYGRVDHNKGLPIHWRVAVIGGFSDV